MEKKQMYRCNSCKRNFNLDIVKKEREIIGVDNQSASIEYEYCPYCDSSDIDIIEIDIPENEYEEVAILFNKDKYLEALKVLYEIVETTSESEFIKILIDWYNTYDIEHKDYNNPELCMFNDMIDYICRKYDLDVYL